MNTHKSFFERAREFAARLLIRMSGTHPDETDNLAPGERFTCCVLGLSMFVPVIAFLVGAIRASCAQYGYVPAGEVLFIGSFATIIFLVDLAIMTTLRKTGSVVRVVVLASCRLALAFVMAWNIATPVVIARFNDHINVEIAARRERQTQQLRERALTREEEVRNSIAPEVRELEAAAARIDAQRQALSAERQRSEQELVKARTEYTREVTGVNPSGLPKEGPIGLKLRVNVMEPAEARLNKLDHRDAELEGERSKLTERIHKLTESVAASPVLSAIRTDLDRELAAVKNATPPGIALRGQILAELWKKNTDLRRDVWMYILWILLLDITPVWAKLCAPAGGLERSLQRREFREKTDIALDREIYPELSRDVAGIQNEGFLEQKRIESELAKYLDRLNGALDVVNQMAKARHEANEQVIKAYGDEGVNSPEAQEALGLVETACSSVAEAYGSFLRNRTDSRA
jgi:hypothetical protein